MFKTFSISLRHRVSLQASWGRNDFVRECRSDRWFAGRDTALGTGTALQWVVKEVVYTKSNVSAKEALILMMLSWVSIVFVRVIEATHVSKELKSLV